MNAENEKKVEKQMSDLLSVLRNQEIEMLLNIVQYKNLYNKIKLRYEISSGSIVRPKSISIFNDMNTTTGLEITDTIKYNNWFYTYNEIKESMELHIF
jgi:hypothetical protein